MLGSGDATVCYCCSGPAQDTAERERLDLTTLIVRVIKLKNNFLSVIVFKLFVFLAI